ncbi:MAG: hypothetical protein ACK4MR_07840, partial [Erythrobacter cryptus]
MRNLLKITVALLGGLAVPLVSCKKKEKDALDPTVFQEAAEDNARVEGEQNFLGDAVDNQGETRDPRRIAGTDSTYLPAC